MFLPANYPHEYYPNEDIWNIHWIMPAGFAADGILKHFGFTKPEVFALREINMLEHIFRKMHETIRADSIFGNYKIRYNWLW
ncbi:MAG: hypothetical protein HFE79_00720 [Ruminiclostridium sp.]|nr:hypothetical protein [Ruminiclostridium sp.]